MSVIEDDLHAEIMGLEAQLAEMTLERDAASARAGCAAVGVEALKLERDGLLAAASMGEKGMLAKVETLQAERDSLRREVGYAVDALTGVLCDPEGTCCIAGSTGDRKIIDDTLGILRDLARGRITKAAQAGKGGAR